MHIHTCTYTHAHTHTHIRTHTMLSIALLSHFPFSNHDVSINTFELHEAYCHRNVKLCPRCSATVQAQSLEEHLSGCSNEAATPLDADRDCEQSEEPTTPTTLCGVCREVVPQGKMDDHVLENHRDIPCDMCEASVPFSGLQEHIRKCHICEYCETVVPDYDRREHQVCA